MKQETLEEAAKKYAEGYRCPATNTDEYCKHDIISAINFGAKWQQERMYSEEEVQVKLYECLGHFAQKHNIIIEGSEIDQWFEQFKKK